MEKTYIIIPALEPESGLCGRIREMIRRIPAEIVVIDDGSGSDYREIFDKIAEMKECTVLRHDENKGKGQALKTGFRYVRRAAGTDCRVLCADSDGQHLAEDGVRLLQTVQQHPNALVLGERNFSGKEVPWKSRIGNRISSMLFLVLSGIRLNDTQTGLRAFGGNLLDLMIRTSGDRFEYETQVLFACAEQRIPILGETTETVYLNGNEGTHFRPIRDSLQVVRALLRPLAAFGLTSLFCALLDLYLFRIFDGAFRNVGALQGIAAATAAARILSAAVNFMLNRNWVFRAGDKYRAPDRKAVSRYFFLCAGIMTTSALSVYGVTELLQIKPAAAKILCDGILFFFSYRIQRKWVFPYGRKDDSTYDN